jgi:hypothetical protein
MISAGPEQRCLLPPPGDGFGRIAPMLQGIAVAWLTTALFSPAVHSAARLPAQGNGNDSERVNDNETGTGSI